MNKILQYSIFILLFISVGIFVSGTTTINDNFINLENINITGIRYARTDGLSTDGLVGYWLFNGDINDYSGHNYKAFPTGSPTFTTDGRFGEALTFDGVDDYARALNVDEFNNTGTLFGYSDNSSDSRMNIGVATGSTFQITATGGASVALTPCVSGTANLGEWNEFYYEFNGTGKNLYVNGIKATGTTCPATAEDNSPAVIFGSRNGATNFYNGTIDNIMLFNRLLSSDERNSLRELNTEFSAAENFGTVNYNAPNGRKVRDRPLFSSAQKTVTVGAGGTYDYETMQEAVDDIPVFVNHDYNIRPIDGTYPEDVIVPFFVSADSTDATDGPCETVSIFGNSSNRNGVSVNSFHVVSSIGCQGVAIKYFNMLGFDPRSDENVSVAVYASNHPTIQSMNFSSVSASAHVGIMAYGSMVTLEGNDFGNGVLQNAVSAKHGGVIYFNNNRNFGSVTDSLANIDAGQVHLNNDTMGMTWVGKMFEYPADDSGIATSKDLTKSRAKLHIVNYFEEPIQPQQTGASSDGLVGYYKGDTTGDFSGNGYNISSVNSATTTSGKFGQSFTSDASNKYWTAANTVLQSNITGASWFAWGKIVGGGTSGQVIFRTGSSGSQQAGLYFGADGTQLKCAITLNGTNYETGKNVNTVDPYINQADWHFYGCSWNATHMNYYIDGQYIANVDVLDNGALNLSTTVLAINGRNGGSHNLNGSSDEIMIFNRTMTDAEMRSWYERGVSEFTSPKANYLKGVDVNPITTSLYNLGSSTLRWFKGWFVNIDVSGNANIMNATINSDRKS